MRLIDADRYRKELLDSRDFEPFKLLDMQPTIQTISGEDAISREAIMIYVSEYGYKHGCNWIDNSILYKYLLSLPSVIIEQKTGHWIYDGNVYRCSLCNHFPWRVNTEGNDEIFKEMKRENAYKFCPNCGCRMEGE